MKLLKKTFIPIVLLCTLALLTFLSPACSKKLPESKPSEYTIGIVTWVGYGPLFVAKEKGFFADENLEINIKIMDGPGEREAAYLAGSLDLFPNSPDAFAIFAIQETKGKIIMPMDESAGADGLVAKKSITSIAELKGKKVGFQNGITSHFFLLYTLNKAGLSGKDLIQENLGAGEAGAAFVAGKLDAAVTWEPWLTKARELPDAHVLVTSKDTPGLLADVLMATDSMIEEHQEELLGFMKAWFRTIEYMKENPEECTQIIAKAFKLEPREVKNMLTTDHFFTIQESVDYFGDIAKPGKVFEVFDLAAKLYKENGVIERTPNIKPLINTTMVQKLFLEKQ